MRRARDRFDTTLPPRPTADGAAGAGVPHVNVGFCSAAASSRAVDGRSAGSFESACAIAASTCGGTESRARESGVGYSVITFATIACAVGPVNGGSPASISYVTAPNA